EPPASATFLTCPCARNPMKRLSGDQNSPAASSVPGSGRAIDESIGGTQMTCWPSLPATKAIVWPSGEIGALAPEILLSPGAKTSNWTVRIAGTGRRTAQVAIVDAIASEMIASAAHARSRVLDVSGDGGVTARAGSEIASS